MDPTCPPGWKTVQKELAEWSDNSSETSMSSSTTVSSSFTEIDEDESEDDTHVSSYVYFKLSQIKKNYKIILEEEDLIK
jgi:hypothetical protein